MHSLVSRPYLNQAAWNFGSTPKTKFPEHLNFYVDEFSGWSELIVLEVVLIFDFRNGAKKWGHLERPLQS